VPSASEPPTRRRSSRRDLIRRVIEESDGPLTVKEIHERSQAEMPSLGLATVYRNIKTLLEDDAAIQAVVLPDGETRYEPADLEHHHHFHCRVCGQVFDLQGCGVSIPDGAKLPGGFEVESHELTLFGRCPGCRRKSGR
jgi:Fur family ferric uptake transcriptional regulator